MTGATSLAALARAVFVSSVLNDEFGTTSGAMSSAASIRSSSSRPPAIRPASRVRVSSTSVSRSSVRSVASRTRAASVLTVAQPAASRPTSVAVASPRCPGRRSGGATFDPPSAEVGREGRVDAADAPLERELLRGRDGDRILGGEVVLGSDGARGRHARDVGLDGLSNSIARGATMSRVASWPTFTSSGGSGRMSAPRIAVRATIRIPAAIARRGTSRRVKRVGLAARGSARGLTGRRALSASRRRGPRDRRWRAPGRRAR